MIVLAVFLVAIRSASAQQAPNAASTFDDAYVLTYFYKDPRPERLVDFIERYDNTLPARQWNAYPPVAGFFAVVFRTHPAWIDKLIPAKFSSKSADTITAALQLSGQSGGAGSRLGPRIREAGSDATLMSEFAGLPPQLESVRISTPTHLDILWGASFASGDGRFARMIADFGARTANRSEQVALDVVHTTLAMMGGPKEIYKQLRSRHSDALTYEIVYAATALWGLQSNARQHGFVDEVLTQYVQENSGSLAAKAFSLFRSKKQQ